MDQTVKTKDTPVPARRSSSAEHQKTVLLNETPAVSSTVRASGGRGSSTGGSVSPSLNLSSSSLAALSQRYDVLSEAGHGNMGYVYKARDRETGETVALKLIKPEIASDQAMTERFKNELLFARRITHKNVCRVYEFNRVGGIAYTSMEFVEGESLRCVLNRFGGLPVRKGVDLALQICSGLREAHAQGIVHRDLKPENVMIDDHGNVKIMDFGIARSMEAGTRLTGAMIGTPAYMAPEQVSGKPVDYRTDIYALGLILYEMFTGTETFRADTAVAIALKQMQEVPTPPHDIDPNIPVYIERAVLKCLEKEPSKRFQSIAELESALRSTRATGAPITSSPQAVATALPMSTSRVAPITHSQEPPALKPTRKFQGAWVIGLVPAILLIVGGLKAMQISKLAAQIQPPGVSAPPVPPKEAFVIPPPAPVEKAPEAAPAKPRPPEVFPRMEWGNRTPRSASDPNTYIWVGRFEREDRAQGVSKRIEDQNLPVEIKPRKGPEGQQFFAVFTGPYRPGEAQKVLEWLRTVGFPKARKVEPGQNQNRNQGGTRPLSHD
ncbi:MAG TPA: protein kinase [Candidatus Acidoferrales bacterium]|nr:protein kinase [Candidatus Acidoferrales bacterium]